MYIALLFHFFPLSVTITLKYVLSLCFSFVFLQLYYHGCLGGGSERPLLVPTQQQEIQRAVRVLDLMRPQETHKIGVLYVGPGQTTEQEILRNSFGSLRYMTFLQVMMCYLFSF